MPLLEETADLSNLSTGGLRNMQNPAGSVTTTNNAPPTSTNPQNQAGSVTTPTSVPGTTTTPPSTVDAITEAQNAGIIGTPQRRGTPGEKEIPDGAGRNRLPRTPIKPTPEVGQGVDFFSNENAKGFVTNTFFQRTDHVDPLRENTISRDSKGDPTRFQNNANRKFTGQSSRLIDFNTPPFDFQGIERSGFVSLFDQNNLFTAKFPQSRLEEIGEADFFDAYYGQLFQNDGLGIRNDNQDQSRNLGFSGYLNPILRRSNAGANIFISAISGKNRTANALPSFETPPDREEPFIIRGIGERWGIDRVEKPNLSGQIGGLVQIDKPAFKGKDVVDSFFNVIDEVGSRLIGRQPSVFLDRYFADVQRINGATNALDFFARGSRFIQAQSDLQRRNAFDTVSTLKYAISEEGRAKIVYDDLISDKYSQYIKSGLDTVAFSTDLNPRAYNPLSLFSVPGVMNINRNSFLDLSSIVASGTIFDFISKKVWEGVKDKAINFINDAGQKLANRFAKQKAKDLIDNSSWDSGEKVKKAEELLTKAREKGEKLRKAAAAFDLIPANPTSTPSKGTLSQVSNNAFDDKGVDRVNLIPYGKDSYEIGGQEVPLDELDWIPFKFKDVRENKSIVFRAILSGITDTFSPEYASERYIGRPDPVYVYQGTTREIAFTFDVYPKSDQELIFLWEKLNYLAGLTYPHFTAPDSSGGRAMLAPFTELTIGQMYTDAPGYINSLTYNVMDNGTYETVFAKLPKYIQVNCGYTYIGKRLPSATQKHFDIPWVAENQFVKGATGEFLDALTNPELFGGVADLLKLNPADRKQARLDFASLETKRVVDENEKYFDNLLAESDPGEVATFDEEGNL